MNWRIILILPLLAFCGSLLAAEKIAETKEGLQAQLGAITAKLKAGEKDGADTLLKNLVLPAPQDWFKNNFGPELGATLATQYGEHSGSLPADVGALLSKALQDGKAEISVEVSAKGNDATATGLQKKALEVLKTPLSLYTAKVGGVSLWSFVYADGAFRLIGKLPALK